MEVWIPLLQSLVWPIFIGSLILFFRGWLRELFDVIKKRIESGSEMSIGPKGFILGPPPKLQVPQDGDILPSQTIERFIEESKKDTPQRELSLDMSKLFYLVHKATYNPEFSKRKVQPYYTITIWLDTDPPELLKRVKKVVYHLHPTFRNPDREITERANNFQLKTLGWGQFNLSADVYFDDNSQPLKLFRYINF